jgi:hypothetical protein
VKLDFLKYEHSARMAAIDYLILPRMGLGVL